jgi:hypothetical protein
MSSWLTNSSPVYEPKCGGGGNQFWRTPYLTNGCSGFLREDEGLDTDKTTTKKVWAALLSFYAGNEQLFTVLSSRGRALASFPFCTAPIILLCHPLQICPPIILLLNCIIEIHVERLN